MELNSHFHSHSLQLNSPRQTSYIWTASHLHPFDELLISWNAHRPSQGHYVILSRVFIRNQWSPWLLYAVWGVHEQFSFHDTTSRAPVHSYQDQVELLDQEIGTGFCIRIEACMGASLDNFYDLYACVSKLHLTPLLWTSPLHSLISLSVPTTSQFCLTHPRSHGFCSPTSTAAVIQYLLSHQQLSPVQFATKVYDAGFDIYGNWSFNVAQAFVELGSEWRCFCTRIKNINCLWDSLSNGLPIVISIKGSLPGSIHTYENGHLIVIKGFDAITKQFLCMDPAFPSEAQTEIAYPWEALLQAWGKRHYLSYFFSKRFA